MSFASVGAVWIAHSTITDHLERVDSVLLRLNLLLLFFVSVLPFPTRMLAEYIRGYGPERIAVTIYGINLLAMSAMTSVVWRHAVGEGMLSGEHPQDEVQEVTKKLTPSLGFYAAAIAIGLLAPRARGLPLPRDRAVPAHPVPYGHAAPPQADQQRLAREHGIRPGKGARGPCDLGSVGPLNGAGRRYGR